jgi:hypothetical protein
MRRVWGGHDTLALSGSLSKSLMRKDFLTLFCALLPASTSRIPSRVIVGRLGVTSEFDGRDFHPHQEDSSAL